jgi:hypothetical protein
MTGSGAHPAAYSRDVSDFCTRGKKKILLGAQLITYLHLPPRLGISGAVTLLFLYAFNAWTESFFQIDFVPEDIQNKSTDTGCNAYFILLYNICSK